MSGWDGRRRADRPRSRSPLGPAPGEIGRPGGERDPAETSAEPIHQPARHLRQLRPRRRPGRRRHDGLIGAQRRRNRQYRQNMSSSLPHHIQIGYRRRQKILSARERFVKLAHGNYSRKHRRRVRKWTRFSEWHVNSGSGAVRVPGNLFRGKLSNDKILADDTTHAR
jgi:hypothetical protein